MHLIQDRPVGVQYNFDRAMSSGSKPYVSTGHRIASAKEANGDATRRATAWGAATALSQRSARAKNVSTASINGGSPNPKKPGLEQEQQPHKLIHK
eukprot:2431187-Rhodomonas_salina.1